MADAWSAGGRAGGPLLIALPTVLLQARDRRRSRPAREAGSRLRTAADAGEVQQWDLLRGPAHWLLPHEHGTMVLAPAGPRRQDPGRRA